MTVNNYSEEQGRYIKKCALLASVQMGWLAELDSMACCWWLSAAVGLCRLRGRRDLCLADHATVT